MAVSWRKLSVFLAAIGLAGCDQPSPPRPAAQAEQETITKQEFLRAVAEANQAAAESAPPEATFQLPDVEGWVHSERRPLPPEDHGFTVAYDHPTGIAVTLYQFTRGLPNIPDNLQGPAVQNEMKRAKVGIQQSVDLGFREAAEEVDSGIVPLGESTQQALWSRYELTADGEKHPSDTYIWPHNNTIIKLRCSGHMLDPLEESQELQELLTGVR